MSVPFAKVQAIGNDFVLFQAADVVDFDLATLAIEACERRYGIGADGMLVLDVLTPNFAQLRMFNADGTEDFCGNGLRCAVNYAVNHMDSNRSFVVEQMERQVRCTYEPGNIQVELPAASFAPRDVPTVLDEEVWDVNQTVDDREFALSALSTGSTHTIIFVNELPDDATFLRYSPIIENHEWFPERTSVMWTQVMAGDHLRIRIWERGVGETLGCGTGSTAAAVAYLRREGRGGAVRVENPGGAVTVSAESWDSPLTLAGDAQTVYQGELRLRQPLTSFVS
ncbi:MAG: diaminopimelate epimerase [Chthonomonas sp.]|nr:diaminopimelate epimerase [Chthonomonas sp.]